MTTPANTVGSPETPDQLPFAAQLYAQTHWASLGHANPFDFDLADTLAQLLHDDTATRAAALRDLQSAVHHANTIYPSTTPVALYIAALLSDPRTNDAGVYDRNNLPSPLRAALLDWLGEMASDVGEESIAAARRHGFDTTADETALREARPILTRAARAFTDAQDADVRHAAATTALLLLDTVKERRAHQPEYAPLIAEILATSSNRYYRARALDSLDAWGHNTASLRRAEPAPTGDASNAWNENPPF